MRLISVCALSHHLSEMLFIIHRKYENASFEKRIELTANGYVASINAFRCPFDLRNDHLLLNTQNL